MAANEFGVEITSEIQSQRQTLNNRGAKLLNDFADFFAEMGATEEAVALSDLQDALDQVAVKALRLTTPGGVW